ncbi:MAG: glycoside hydrolase 100 family protein [Gemmatimonadota bacterium]|nr:glycoside hydrolase 100 family protein [Gemmatimonadota bacterium]
MSGLDQYGEAVGNVFNIYPESMPDWIEDWLPNDESGYFAGNVGPGRIDFRFFAQGNLMACFTGLATPAQRDGLMSLVETRWSELVGEAPLRIVYPAL